MGSTPVGSADSCSTSTRFMPGSWPASGPDREPPVRFSFYRDWSVDLNDDGFVAAG